MGVGQHGEFPDQVGWPVNLETTPVRERTIAMLCNDMTTPETEAFLKRLGGDHWPGAMYTMTGWDFTHPPATTAVSYVLCLRDNILPLAWQETFAQRFHAARCIRIDAGHQVMNTCPHSLTEVLRREVATLQ